MNIFVTGAAGYIASHTIVELVNAGYEVIGIDNFSNCSRDVPKRLGKLCDRFVKIYDCDLRDEYTLSNIFQYERVEAIIHFAGLKSIRESYEKPFEYYDNNIKGTLNLLRMVEKYQIESFIFSSSASVYGFESIPPFKESYPVSLPVHPYGKTKYMIEQMLFDTNFTKSVILRYFNPVGAHASGLIGENPKGIPNNLMPIIVSVAAGRLDKLTIFGNDYDTPDGTCIRDYIHVVDLAKGHLKALEFASRKRKNRVFNLGTGKGTSVLELVKTFERVNDLKINYEFGKRRDGDLPICVSCCEEANDKLGWKAELGLEEMCKSAWNWELNMKKFKA